MPKVSVCVPVSREDTLHATLTSILQQSWKDWELIAVGQGSLENPRVKSVYEIVHDFASKDSRIKYCHIDAAGASRAKNASIQAATGEIIAEIDDDAEAAPDWLEVMVTYLDAHPDIDLIGGSVIKPEKQYRGFAVCPAVEPDEVVYDPTTMDSPPEGWNWISCNVGIRREVFSRVGFYDDYLGPGSIFPAADDTDLLLRMEAAGIKMASSPRLVVYHTYGYRYGLRAFIKHQYNYGYGNGGMAAKLSLAGDPRGEEWYHYARKERLTGWTKPLRPHRLLRGAYGWFIFKQAYERCSQEFLVENNLLVQR